MIQGTDSAFPGGSAALLSPAAPSWSLPRWCICCSPPLAARPAPALNASAASCRTVAQLQDGQPELSASWEGGNVFARLNSNGRATLSLLSSLLVQNITFVKTDKELRKLLKVVGWKSPWNHIRPKCCVHRSIFKPLKLCGLGYTPAWEFSVDGFKQWIQGFN